MLLIAIGLQVVLYLYFSVPALNRALIFITNAVLNMPVPSNSIGIITASLVFGILVLVFIMSRGHEKYDNKLLSMNALFINSMIRFMFVNIIVIGLYSIKIEQYVVRGADLQSIAILGAYAIGTFIINSKLTRIPLVMIDLVKKVGENETIKISNLNEEVLLGGSEELLVKLMSSNKRIENIKVIPRMGQGIVIVNREKQTDTSIVFQIKPGGVGYSVLGIYLGDILLTELRIRVTEVLVQPRAPLPSRQAVVQVTYYRNGRLVRLHPQKVPVGTRLLDALHEILLQNNVDLDLKNSKIYMIIDNRTIPIDDPGSISLREETYYEIFIEPIIQVPVEPRRVERPLKHVQRPLKTAPVQDLKSSPHPTLLKPTPTPSTRHVSKKVSDEELSALLNSIKKVLEDLW